MRIHVLSDLHLEFAPFQVNNVDADAIVLAGDVHTGTNGIKWILNNIQNRPVIYVLGNHEFYGQKIPKLVSEIKEIAQGTNVHVLENGAVEINDVTFLGATLWTDFRLDGDAVLAEAAAQIGMTDFRRIRITPSYRRFRPADARCFHSQSFDWLVQEVEKRKDKKVVVVTHHAPSPQAIPSMHRNDPLNPAFASNLEQFIAESGIDFWVYGHIHRRKDFTIGKTRVVANPRGYPTEPHTGFDPSLVIEI
jgi:predicted phosphodiesterase